MSILSITMLQAQATLSWCSIVFLRGKTARSWAQRPRPIPETRRHWALGAILKRLKSNTRSHSHQMNCKMLSFYLASITIWQATSAVTRFKNQPSLIQLQMCKRLCIAQEQIQMFFIKKMMQIKSTLAAVDPNKARSASWLTTTSTAMALWQPKTVFWSPTTPKMN